MAPKAPKVPEAPGTPDGFLRSLFRGRLDSSHVLPFPWPDAETRETTDTICEMVRDWAEEAIDAAAIDREKHIPESVLDGLRELGLFGLTIPEEYGGSGCGQWTYAHMMETVAHRCASTVTVLGGHLGLGMKGLYLYGTDEQKKRWFPELASGERIAAFALTEASAGSDAGALRTTADPDGNGGWRLDGRKLWITNGGFAGWFLVFARTPDPERPEAPLLERPITAFCVPRETPGLTTGEPENKMGLCGSSTTEVGLEGVVVGDDLRIGPLGGGFKVALNVLNSGRHGLAACCIGQAKLARDLAVAHATEREQFGHPIADFGMMRELIAGMDADIYAMEAGCWLTAGLVDRGAPETMLEAASCKMFATERLWDICNSALQLTGGTGFMREYPFERILRDARINLIFEGTNQVLRMMLSVQGTRALVRGEAAKPEESGRFEGVHPELEDEGRVLAELSSRFSEEVRSSVERHGRAIRRAQYDLKRLADLAVGLFQTAAVLSRVSSRSDALGERERDLARLACRRIEAGLRATLRQCGRPMDELVDRVAGARTRGSG